MSDSCDDCTLSQLTRLYGMLGLKLRLQGKIFLLQGDTSLPDILTFQKTKKQKNLGI